MLAALPFLSALLSTIRVPEYEQYPPRHLEPLTGESPPCTRFLGAACDPHRGKWLDCGRSDPLARRGGAGLSRIDRVSRVPRRVW